MIVSDNYVDEDNMTTNIGNSLGSQSVYESISQNYSPSDLTGFQTNFLLPVQGVAKDIGGYNSSFVCTTQSSSCEEANLDVQYLMSQSQVTPTTYYYDSSSQFMLAWATALNSMTNPPLVNSVSYGTYENTVPKSYAMATETQFQYLALRGVTIVVSSGDDGVAGSNAQSSASSCGYYPQWPASSPHVTTVGATQGPESNQPEKVCWCCLIY